MQKSKILKNICKESVSQYFHCFHHIWRRVSRPIFFMLTFTLFIILSYFKKTFQNFIYFNYDIFLLKTIMFFYLNFFFILFFSSTGRMHDMLTEITHCDLYKVSIFVIVTPWNFKTLQMLLSLKDGRVNYLNTYPSLRKGNTPSWYISKTYRHILHIISSF